jgi:hypothetical protein
MSNLLFQKSDVLKSAQEVVKCITESRRKEALEEWGEMHKQGLVSKLLRRPSPTVPTPSSEWVDSHVENNFLSGDQLEVAKQFVQYCNRPDAADVIAISREDAHKLWLI